MIVTLNGAPAEIPDDSTVAALITDRAGPHRGTAAVVDGEVVPRSTWADVRLRAGQSIELITAVQGG